MSTANALNERLCATVSTTFARTRVTVILMLGIAWAGGATQVAQAQNSTAVLVEKDRVIIDIMPPKLRVKPPRSGQYGFYAWRIDIQSGGDVSFAFTADTAMRSNGLRDIVRASSLRRCADPKDFSTLRCRIPMTDTVVVQGDGIRMLIRDPSLVAFMWKHRPTGLWGSTFEPNGQYRVDRIQVRFEDSDTVEVRLTQRR